MYLIPIGDIAGSALIGAAFRNAPVVSLMHTSGLNLVPNLSHKFFGKIIQMHPFFEFDERNLNLYSNLQL